MNNFTFITTFIKINLINFTMPYVASSIIVLIPAITPIIHNKIARIKSKRFLQ